MKYLKIALVLVAFVLLGAGCQLQQPRAIDSSDSPDDKELQRLQDENKKLEKENKKLQNEIDEQEETEEDDAEDEEAKDDEADEEASSDEISEPDEDADLNERGREVINETSFSNDQGDTRINLLLVSDQEPDPKQSEGPYLKFGCDQYLYPLTVELDEEKTQSNLATAIVELLITKKDEYKDSSGLTNHVSGHGLVLANVKYEDGTRILEFEGEITSAGVCEDAAIKAQIEEVTALYSNKFEIRLNGEESEWRCLFDGSGECS